MANDLGIRSVRAASRFLNRRGYDVIEKLYDDDIDIVATLYDEDTDEDVLHFVKVFSADNEDFLEDAEDMCYLREKMEKQSLNWFKEHRSMEISVCFDCISFILCGKDRAMLRFHINCFNETV